MSKHERRRLAAIGEAANTNAMKLVKTDKELCDECRGIADALVGKIAEMRARGLVVQLGLNNGAQEGQPVKLTVFKVDKEIVSYVDLSPQQGGQR